MTNLDSILKSRHITLPTKVRSVKSMVFTVVMCGYESWTIKKAEHRRIDTFELWCWRRLLRVPWTARRSNQSILKEISPKYSLERLMLKVKLQYFHHLMQIAVRFSSVTQSCPTLCDPINRSMPGLPTITNSWSSLRFMSIESVMPSSHLILCRPLSSCLQSFPASASFPMSQFFTSLSIRKIQIKTTVRYHLTPIGMAINKKSTNNKCWKACEKRESFCIVGGNVD